MCLRVVDSGFRCSGRSRALGPLGCDHTLTLREAAAASHRPTFPPVTERPGSQHSPALAARVCERGSRGSRARLPAAAGGERDVAAARQSAQTVVVCLCADGTVSHARVGGAVGTDGGGRCCVSVRVLSRVPSAPVPG